MRQTHDLLMRSLGKFYGADDNIEKLVGVIDGRSDISLRMIDWFVTNYAKKRNIIHKRRAANSQQTAPLSTALKEGPERVSYFSVYLSYREELRTYSKQQFDPFRRNDHIVFRYGEDEALETTVGQLNFFRWAIENGILDYIRDHRAEIDEAMTGKQSGPSGGSEGREGGLGAGGGRQRVEEAGSGLGAGAGSGAGLGAGSGIGSGIGGCAGPGLGACPSPGTSLGGKGKSRRPPVVLSVRSVISFD